ncbi:HipA-like protein family [Alloalcanivorax dieselolei B5]|uniref:HipA-like protein family n=1 Tax=Alcanivorax dieselolei (strain DSM 16502 / CGMCC 1.3690 / MCCC 1A00001 / B-5) TaxID=930169 RepID=K0CAL5_ALCDB|nr:HipA domain-containing protein [Alloalcanivorax dieselolei]AFT69550.1 HipA-like protein family [Alloalcanivorax dieselolei B5]GGK04290.1 phosphatidylinositol kinase [Alloalcanivorax dieselolei]
MISDKAYIWVFLPGLTEPVVCGVVAWDGVEYVFRYGKSYLARPDAMPLSIPGRPLGELTGDPYTLENELSGALRDAAPDAWGRRIIQREIAKTIAQANSPRESEPGEIDYLLGAGSDRIGALDTSESPHVYSPLPRHTSPLEDALKAAEKMERGEELDEKLDAALNHGTSIGGARPKVLFQQDGDFWVAKFSSSSDTLNMIAAEAGAMKLAARAGLNVADVDMLKVAGKDILLVRRFDRQTATNGTVTRRHMLSAMTLLDLDEYAVRAGHASYLELADLLRKYARNFERDGRELFQRMVFNILIGNTDDHARNHACFWDGHVLDLTPAYDVCPQPRLGYSADLAMVVGDQGRAANLKNALSQAERFGLGDNEAAECTNALRRTVEASWKAEFSMAGMDAGDIEYLARATLLSPSIFD